jgi:16S rRNA G966 N2-methylase RsmD
MAENSLVIFTRASQMLAEATTLQKAKELKDLALTAADWARRKGLGEEAVQYARSYALDAERRMGQIITETELNKGAVSSKIDAVTRSNRVKLPKLSDFGLTKRDSAEAQKLARIPEEKFLEIKSGRRTIHDVKKEIRTEEIQQKRAEIASKASAIPVSDRYSVECANITSWHTDQKFDYIITDPPYPHEYVTLYATLAQRANDWLMPGGLLIAMCGQSYLDDIYKLMSKYLQYYWTSCYLTPGQPKPLRQVNVNTTWKPLLMFKRPGDVYKGKIFGDVFTSDGNDKSLHEWGQSVSGMLSIIKGVCTPGVKILDTFCGAGTTGVAAIRHGCLFTGIDINQENVNISKTRLSKEV